MKSCPRRRRGVDEARRDGTGPKSKTLLVLTHAAVPIFNRVVKFNVNLQSSTSLTPPLPSLSLSLLVNFFAQEQCCVVVGYALLRETKILDAK